MRDSVLFVSEFRDFNPLELQSQHGRYKREEQILRLLTYRKTKFFTCASTVLFVTVVNYWWSTAFPPQSELHNKIVSPGEYLWRNLGF